MKFDLFGEKMTAEEVTRELIYNNKYTNAKIDNQIYPYLRAQRKINAEDRIERETDPKRKRLMQELYSHGKYNFDYYFGEDPLDN